MTGAEVATVQAMHEAGAAMLITFAACGAVMVAALVRDGMRWRRVQRAQRRWRSLGRR